MDNLDLRHRWHPSSHKAQEVNAGHQEVEEKIVELDIQWSLRRQNNGEGHHPRWIEGSHNHQDVTPHLGATIDEGVHLGPGIGESTETATRQPIQ
eukprot:5195486-Amphidinium_carterae.2